MFVPIGFMSPQGGSGGFDVTLGGTLSVSLHWDFTDSSTMTLSGTDLTNITDKVGSETLVLRPTQANGTPAPATFATDKTTFTGTGLYWKELNWIPDSMRGTQDFTVVQFLLNDFDALPASRIVAPWSIEGTRVDNEGQKPLRPTQFTPNYDPYSLPTCAGFSGTYYFGIQRFDSGWTGIKQRFLQATAQADKNMLTVTYDKSNTDIGTTLNNNTLCITNDSFIGAQQAGAGLVIGGRDSDYNGNWNGYMYHTIVYPFVFSQTNVNDLYASWVSFNA